MSNKTQLQTNNTNLASYTDRVNNLINIANSLPEAGSDGVQLPTLTNKASKSELFSGKELIDDSGNIVTGTFTIDNELNTIDGLITNIQTALQGKAAGGNAEPTLQDKTVTPTTSTQTIKPDTGYDGLSQVTVNAMPTATQATPSISINSSGLITASATQSAGYVAAGTKSGTKQLTTQAAKTITPSTSSQTAVASGRYTTGAVTVAAIPSTYVQPSGTLAVTSNGIYNVNNYASVNVSVSGSDNPFGNSIPTISISDVKSTAEGKVIYVRETSDGGIETVMNNLSYFPPINEYYYPIGPILLNTPIIVLTAGTVTMPTVDGASYAHITSGTGYAIYQYYKDGSDMPEEEIPEY